MKNINTSLQLKDFIWQNVKDLPQENVNEILNFIIYIRKKIYNPELFNINYSDINKELIQKSKNETIHLEEEFLNYKTIYPHE